MWSYNATYLDSYGRKNSVVVQGRNIGQARKCIRGSAGDVQKVLKIKRRVFKMKYVR